MKNSITDKDVIHCKTESEFNRMIELFGMDRTFLVWDIYRQDTVLYPLENLYGEINGYCIAHGLNIIESEKVN